MDIIDNGCEFLPLHSITQNICMHVWPWLRVWACACACVSVVWWRAVLSWAQAERHWAHSDSLLHMCNHDAPPANERVKGGRTRFLWQPSQGEKGEWWRVLLFRVVVGLCALIVEVSIHAHTCTCAAYFSSTKQNDTSESLMFQTSLIQI